MNIQGPGEEGWADLEGRQCESTLAVFNATGQQSKGFQSAAPPPPLLLLLRHVSAANTVCKHALTFALRGCSYQTPLPPEAVDASVLGVTVTDPPELA